MAGSFRLHDDKKVLEYLVPSRVGTCDRVLLYCVPVAYATGTSSMASRVPIAMTRSPEPTYTTSAIDAVEALSSASACNCKCKISIPASGAHCRFVQREEHAKGYYAKKSTELATRLAQMQAAPAVSSLQVRITNRLRECLCVA